MCGVKFFLAKKFAPHPPITDITSMGLLTSMTSISGLLLLHSTKEGGMDYTSTTIHPHQKGGWYTKGLSSAIKMGGGSRPTTTRKLQEKKGGLYGMRAPFEESSPYNPPF